jgi:dolichol-phosphate mannosyltransferase
MTANFVVNNFFTYRDRRLRCLQRIGRRGQRQPASRALHAGIHDGDTGRGRREAHDEKLLPQMLAILKSEPVGLVIGSRHEAGSGIGEWNGSMARASSIRVSPGSTCC